MLRRIDHAEAYYWRVEFIQPADPDDDRYVVLHGDEGEIAGPMSMALAEAWMDRLHNRRASLPPNFACLSHSPLTSRVNVA